MKKILLILSFFIVVLWSVSSQAQQFTEQQILNQQYAYQTKIAYNDSGDIEYIGRASAGSAESSTVWQIQKIEYSGSDIVGVSFAGDSPVFNYSWTLRASYSY
jgi:hypothetical protein